MNGKLNQDTVELRFSAVHGFSPNDHPDVQQFTDLNAIKAIISPIENVISSKANVCQQNMRMSDSHVQANCEVFKKLKTTHEDNELVAKANMDESRRELLNNVFFFENAGVEEVPSTHSDHDYI